MQMIKHGAHHPGAEAHGEPIRPLACGKRLAAWLSGGWVRFLLGFSLCYLLALCVLFTPWYGHLKAPDIDLGDGYKVVTLRDGQTVLVTPSGARVRLTGRDLPDSTLEMSRYSVDHSTFLMITGCGEGAPDDTRTSYVVLTGKQEEFAEVWSEREFLLRTGRSDVSQIAWSRAGKSRPTLGPREQHASDGWRGMLLSVFAEYPSLSILPLLVLPLCLLLKGVVSPFQRKRKRE